MGLLACGGKDNPGAQTPGGGTRRRRGPAPAARRAAARGRRRRRQAAGAAPRAETPARAGAGGTGGAGPIDAALDVPVTMTDAPGDPAGRHGRPRRRRYSCANLPRPADPYRLVDPFPQLPPFEQPSGAVQAPGQPQFWYVTEQGGRSSASPTGPTSPAPRWCWISTDRVDSEGDAGILAIAFHPKFAENGQMFLSYALRGRAAALAPVALHLEQRRRQLRSRQRGGADRDPPGRSGEDPPQLRHALRAGRLPVGRLRRRRLRRGQPQRGPEPGHHQRQDPAHRRRSARGRPCPTPSPPTTRSSAAPARAARSGRSASATPGAGASIPPRPGVLWVGELGSDRREELDRVVRGGNYGWNRLEGSLCLAPPCNTAGLTPPHVEYKHSEGKSITGRPGLPRPAAARAARPADLRRLRLGQRLGAAGRSLAAARGHPGHPAGAGLVRRGAGRGAVPGGLRRRPHAQGGARPRAGRPAHPAVADRLPGQAARPRRSWSPTT